MLESPCPSCCSPSSSMAGQRGPSLPRAWSISGQDTRTVGSHFCVPLPGAGTRRLINELSIFILSAQHLWPSTCPNLLRI